MTAGETAAAAATRDVDEIAHQVVDLVRRSDPAAAAEATVARTAHALTRFANSSIHQNVASTVTDVRLRLHVGGRTAGGSTSLTDADGLQALVDRTLAAARLSPPDLQWAGLTPPTAVPAAEPVDEATAYAEPAARADRVRAFVGSAGGLETAGYCATTFGATAFANSAGQVARAEWALAAMDGIARAGGGSDGVARLAASRLGEIDGARLGARAATKARAGRDAAELPPGRYEVVLEPTAVADLLDLFALYGFNGKAVTEGRSFVEVGTGQFDAAISLVDEPFGTAGVPFDVEGTPKHRLVLVDAGVTSAVPYDRRSAAVAGAASTGHAIAGGASWGALATDLHLLPAAAEGHPVDVDGPAADSSVAELVAQVRRGLLVTDHWYTRVLDPRTLVATGLTRNGLWLIENGEITGPVQNLRFTQSYPQALGPGAVLAVGSHAVALPAGWARRCDRAPALRLASWNFTGNASG